MCIRDSVRYVLANTIQQKDFDGRIPQPLKEWAKTVDVCPENASRFLVDKPNPGLTALFVDAFRQQTEAQKDVTSETVSYTHLENTLMEIERGNADADAFLSGIVRMTGDLVKAYPFLSDAEAQRFGTGKEEIGKCPRCGSPVYVGKGNFYCSNKDCSFCLWEDNKFFSSKKKKLTKKIAKELLDKGWCRVTGLYTPKKPQLYDAVIRLDDSGGKYVSFKMEFDR